MVPQRFPESVSVEEDNQKILDACKYVIVSVLPKQGGTSIMIGLTSHSCTIFDLTDQ